MNRTTQQAATLAIALHVIGLAFLVVLAIWPSLLEKPKPVVIELVDLRAPAPPTRPTASPQPVPPEDPPPMSVAELEALVVPDFETPRPTPDLPPPAPVPTPTPVPKQDPKPAPKPTPKPPAPRPKTSYEDFLRQQGGQIETTPARKTPTATPSRTVPEIQTRIREELAAISSPALPESWSTARKSEYDTYRQGLVARLQALFRPVGAIGLEVTIAYTVLADGRLTGLRIVKSSGHGPTDEAALDAFRRLGRYRPTPDGEAYASEVLFKNVAA